jgi:hypothetical protein
MPTIEVRVALGEDDSYEVATDKYTAIERLEEEGSGDELAGTICRFHLTSRRADSLSCGA